MNSHISLLHWSRTVSTNIIHIISGTPRASMGIAWHIRYQKEELLAIGGTNCVSNFQLSTCPWHYALFIEALLQCCFVLKAVICFNTLMPCNEHELLKLLCSSSKRCSRQVLLMELQSFQTSNATEAGSVILLTTLLKCPIFNVLARGGMHKGCVCNSLSLKCFLHPST